MLLVNDNLIHIGGIEYYTCKEITDPERLGFNHVTYTIATYKDMVVSKCSCFITKDTELHKIDVHVQK